jgi:hypothetical protein
MATTEGRLDAFMEQVTNRLNTMNERISSVERSLNERLNDQRAWLIALTALAGAQLAALVTLALAMCRLGR